MSIKSLKQNEKDIVCSFNNIASYSNDVQYELKLRMA